MSRIKHQLLIHLDYSPAPGGLEIRYSYPFSRPHELREQVIRVPRRKILVAVKVELDALVEALCTRISTPKPVRLPHAEITPSIRRAITTIVIQDQHRNLPIARLYYLEEIKEIGSRIERQVRMEPGEFSASERKSWGRLRTNIKRIVWEDYKRLVAAHLFPE